MDIVVQRYNPWMADASILKTRLEALATARPAASSVGSTANLPTLTTTRIITQTFRSSDDRPHRSTTLSFPVRVPAVLKPQRFGLESTAPSTTRHSRRSFHTGTTVTVFWDNTRSSSNAATSSIPMCSPLSPSASSSNSSPGGPLHQPPQHHHRRKQPQDRRPGLRPAGHHHHDQHHQRLLGTRLRPRKRQRRNSRP